MLEWLRRLLDALTAAQMAFNETDDLPVSGGMRQDPNPWLTDEEAEEHLGDTIMATVGFLFPVVNADHTVSFFTFRNILNTWVQMFGPDDSHTATRAILFETARVAHHLFAEDTDADRMYFPDELIGCRVDNRVMMMGPESRAFFDAALRGDFPAAVRVGLAIALRAPRLFPSDSPDAVSASMGRNFAANLLMIMCGTLGAQLHPDRMNMIGSPMADAEDEEAGTDDE